MTVTLLPDRKKRREGPELAAHTEVVAMAKTDNKLSSIDIRSLPWGDTGVSSIQGVRPEWRQDSP